MIIKNTFVFGKNKEEYLANTSEATIFMNLQPPRIKQWRKTNALLLLNHTHSSFSHFEKTEGQQRNSKETERHINTEETVRGEKEADTGRIRCSSSPSTSI